MTPIAKKFVQWEVPALETLQNSRAYKLRESLNNGGKLSREDKNWITREIRNGTYFNRGIALRGNYFNFSDVLKRYFVKPDFDNASPYSILSIANASSSGLMASCCGVVNRVSV